MYISPCRVDHRLELNHALFKLFEAICVLLDCFLHFVVGLLHLPLELGVGHFLLLVHGRLELLKAFRDRIVHLVDLSDEILHRSLLYIKLRQFFLNI